MAIREKERIFATLNFKNTVIMNHFHGLKVVALILALCFGSVLNAQQEKSEDNFEISLRTGAGFKHYNLDFAKSNDAPFINLGASIKTGPVIIVADYSLEVPQAGGQACAAGLNVEYPFLYLMDNALSFAAGPRYQFDNIITEGHSLKSHSIGIMASATMNALSLELGYMFGLNEINKNLSLEKVHLNTFQVKLYLNIPTKSADNSFFGIFR